MEQLIEFVTNHWMLSVAFVVVAGMLMANLWGGAVAAGTQVGTADAIKLINHEHALVLDVREAAEFNKGHILDAVNLPMSKFEERLAEFNEDRDRAIVVCCATGSVAGRASGSMKKAGFSKLHRLRGGMAAWQTDNLPLEH